MCAVSSDCEKRARAGRSNSCSPGVTGISQLQELSYFMAAVTMCVTGSLRPTFIRLSMRLGSKRKYVNDGLQRLSASAVHGWRKGRMNFALRNVRQKAM